MKWDKIPDDKLRVEYKVLEELFHRHVKDSGEYIEQLKEELEKERAVVDFYADEKHWRQGRILVYDSRLDDMTKCGAKRARQRQKERKDNDTTND